MSNMKQPSEPGWYVTADGNDLLSFDGDAWHMHNISAEALLFADGDLDAQDWTVVLRTFNDDAFPLRHVDLQQMLWAVRRLDNLITDCGLLAAQYAGLRLSAASRHNSAAESTYSALENNYKALLQDLAAGRFDHE